MELMDGTLYNIIYSQEVLGEEHIQFWIYGILLALEYLHGSDVVHRDLKPQNILVNRNLSHKALRFWLGKGALARQRSLKGRTTHRLRRYGLVQGTRSLAGGRRPHAFCGSLEPGLRPG